MTSTIQSTNNAFFSRKGIRLTLMSLSMGICVSCGSGGAADEERPTIVKDGFLVAPGVEAELYQPEVFALPDEDQSVTWWMHERFESGFDSYNNTIDHKYDPDYVYPDSWGIGFSICEEFPIQNGREFQWLVTSTDGEYQQQYTTSNCLSDGEVRLPALKEHTVQVTTVDGGVEQGSHVTVFTPRDLLIVSMGDSIASGESLNTFVDRQCHRSRISGHAKAAEQIEFDDPHTSVTFLFLACSSAKLEWGVLFPQTKFQPFVANSISEFADVVNGELELRSEISQYRDLVEYLCDSRTTVCKPNPRSIDKLFLTIGANDLGWSKYIKACAKGKSLDDIEVEDILPIAALAHFGDVRWSDIKDQPLQQLGNALVNVLDIGLLFFDEVGFAVYDEIRGWFGSANSCGTAAANTAVGVGMSSLEKNFSIVDAIANGKGYSLIQEVLYGDSYDYLDRVDGSLKAHLVCTFGTDLQRLNGGYNCTSAATENVTHSTFMALKTDEVYLLQYPYDIFSDRDGDRGGCGFLSGVGEEDADWFYELGQNLDRFYRSYADYYRWNYVWRINDRFETDGGIHHGYCAKADSWYEGVTEAFLDGNDSGTLHPNTAGHAAIAEELLQVVARPKASRDEKYNVTVRFEDASVIGLDENVADDDQLTLRAHERLKRGGGELLAHYKFQRNSAIDLSSAQTETSFTIAYDDQIWVKVNADFSLPPSSSTTCMAKSAAAVTDDCNPASGNNQVVNSYEHSTIVKTFTVKQLVESEVPGCRKTSLNYFTPGTNVSHLCQFEESAYVEGEAYRTTSIIFTINIAEDSVFQDCQPNCVALPVNAR